jgi:chromosome partitioning protein
MKILGLVSQKGGTGKSLLAAHLAVAFEETGVPAVAIDLDPQESLKEWGTSRRGEAPTVVAALVKRLATMLDASRKAGIGIVIIDTPPHSDKNALGTIAVADFVLVPIRPSIFDLRSIRDTVHLLRLAKKEDRAAILLNAVPQRGSPVNETEEAARSYGIEVAPIRIFDRNAFSLALMNSCGITEYEPRGEAAAELRALRAYVEKRLDLRGRRGL